MEINKIDKIIKIIIYDLHELFNVNNNKSIDVNFNNIENHTFAFINVNNGVYLKKIDLNLEKDELSNFYIKLYDNIKTSYLNNPFISLGLYQNINLTDPDNYFLTIILKDIHQNKLYIELKDKGLEKEALETIKNNWINLVNEKKMKKMK